jgi:hypothetical protein
VIPGTFPHSHAIPIAALVATHLAALLLMAGCAPRFVKEFDPFSYRRLIEAKVEALDLYAGFGAGASSPERVKALRLRLRALAEYERQKGPANVAAYQQVLELESLFNVHLRDCKDPNSSLCDWNRFRETLEAAFDKAIGIAKDKPGFQ